MIRKLIRFVPLPLVACAVISGCDAPPETTEEQTSNIEIQVQPFVNPTARSGRWTTPPGGTYGYWLLCNSNEVVVGVHFNDSKVTCASLNGGLIAVDHIEDPAQGSDVPWNNYPYPAYMHGCPLNRWVQGIKPDSWGDESLLCVSLKKGADYQGVSRQYVDGYGSSTNQGTGSYGAYGISPNMHVCSKNVFGKNEGIYGMVGVHRNWNDLFCAN
jgi:hypothetical protein